MTMTRIICLGVICSSQAALANTTSIRAGAIGLSEETYQLQMAIFLTCCVVTAIVCTCLLLSMLYRLLSPGLSKAVLDKKNKIEILWYIFFISISLIMGSLATQKLLGTGVGNTAELTIKVTGSRWKWHYQYVDYEQQPIDIAYHSITAPPPPKIANEQRRADVYLLNVDKPLVLPKGKKVRLLFSSDDIIHSWWVPEISVEANAIPNFINEFWLRVEDLGIYRGQCTELCSDDNVDYMPIVVDVRSIAQFEKWLLQQPLLAEQAALNDLASLSTSFSMEEMMAQGKGVYSATCAACHQPNGMGLPGLFPALKDNAVIQGDVATHIDIIAHGRPGTAMQAYAGQLSIKQLAAVITYQRNAWGNDSGVVIQPNKVQAVLSAEENHPDNTGSSIELAE